jgi:asparagine synthase (glutamine-hydrolysing)
MCAINGFSFKDRNLCEKMNVRTAHRGPDGTGVYVENGVTLGHNRLSIIDLSESASQPMHSSDGRYTIVYNGELYNFRELKRELTSKYQFKTQSDTEVVLAAYSVWGKGCTERFNGMFAFAIWDNQKEEIFLARDQIGVKPLYYYWDGHMFIFASEIKGILEHNVPRNVNMAALEHFFRVLYVPEPLTMFENIYKFPPAHTATYRRGTLMFQSYWRVDYEKGCERGDEPGIGKIKGLIEKSVERQLVSDKPVGIYLSGGMDSSAVLQAAVRNHKDIDAFSIGFELEDNEDRGKFNADFELAKRTAKHFGARHHTVLVSAREVPELLERAVWHSDEPISNPTALSMYKLAGLAREHVAVVLGGDGGDELFGGYERYRLSRIADSYQKLPAMLRSAAGFIPKLRKLNTAPGVDQFALFMFQKDSVLARVLPQSQITDATRDFFGKKYFTKNLQSCPEIALMRADRESWLVDQSLALTDKMSMAHGLEARVPILDTGLVQYAADLSRDSKVTARAMKIALKRAYIGDLPDFLFSQPKRGWFSPGAKWLRRENVFAMASELLDEKFNKETQKLFNFAEAKKILRDHCDKKQYNLTIIWSLMTFQLWAKQYRVRI